MHRAAVAKLRKSDPVLARIIERVGPCRLHRSQGRGSYFEALAEAIVYQQLNGKAAETIFNRFRALYGPGAFPAPERIVKTPDMKLRKVGLSRQKLSYLKDLAGKVASGEVRLDTLESLPDDGVVETLTRVKGIGKWTAEMFLMFRLGRPDVLPTGDYGFQTAVKKAYGLKDLPRPAKLQELGEAWRPHRSVATWYFWRSLDAE